MSVEVASSTAGSGAYFIRMPTGYTLDGLSTPNNFTAGQPLGKIATFSASQGFQNEWTLYQQAPSLLYAKNEGTTSVWGSGTQGNMLHQTHIAISITAAIVEWL